MPTSSRFGKLICCVPVIMLCWFIYFFISATWSPHYHGGILAVFIKPWLQEGEIVYLEPIEALHRSSDTAHYIFSRLFSHKDEKRPNIFVSILQHCPNEPNDITHHVRLPNSPLHQISMTPPGEALSSNQYFNPTLLPLPLGSPYHYLLVSRLVTAGLHQEAHICAANLDPVTKNIYCAVGPQRLNIPPMPSLRCEGRWADFPDIPGFHDPRIFWSGKGEPLVIVNGGSQYGCVGLWLVDLRAVVPDLITWLRKSDGRDDDAGLTKNRGFRTQHFSPKLSYSHLTEITRNPVTDQHMVEKNWVLFFPKSEDAWVTYDLLEQSQGQRTKTQMVDEETLQPETLLKIDINFALNNTTTTPAGHVVGNKSEEKENPAFNLSMEMTRDKMVPARNDTSNLTTSPSNTSTNMKRSSKPGALLGRARSRPGRSLAKLIGLGYTTPNLTSPFETPCFDERHLVDAMNNTSHWHQGSNSLRLVLCTRTKSTSKTAKSTKNCHLTKENEEELVETGRVVHFMVIHRKFSNALELPMRYERYFLVWEARWPFTIIGISKYPILFERESAQPWTKEENWPVGMPKADEEATKWRSTYFTYTPSLAWAWRNSAAMEENGNDEIHETSLGTGYLDDSVIVGIGMDDVHQAFVHVQVEKLLTCLRLCPDHESME